MSLLRPQYALDIKDAHLTQNLPTWHRNRGGRRWRWPRSWRVLDELTDSTSQFARLVFRDQGVTVSDLHQPRVGQQCGQPPSVCWGHDAVFHSPDDERWTFKG